MLIRIATGIRTWEAPLPILSDVLRIAFEDLWLPQLPSLDITPEPQSTSE